jgi:hypothetical protein
VTELPYTFKYTIGDWSDDGHGKTDVLQIRSNHTIEKITEAYNKSRKTTGIDFVYEVASDYQDRTYPVEKFLDLGLDRDTACWENDPDDDPEEWTCGYTDHYLLLMTWFCKLSLPDLIMESVEVPRGQDLAFTIHAVQSAHHGYGLFD